MSTLSNERICYFNGEYIPESQALVPYRDRSFLFFLQCRFEQRNLQ